MPVERLNTNAFAIRELTFGRDQIGNYLSFICPKAMAYVLCFSSNQPITRADLHLSEEELRALYTQRSLEKSGYRLQCVHKQVFDAQPVFRNFTTRPPEQIQVWSMLHADNGTFRLYIPDDPMDQICYVPLQYNSTIERVVSQRENVSTLRVCVNQVEEYTDGALLYQVGDAFPIPMTRDMLNRDLTLLVEPEAQIRILVDQAFQGKYVQQAG